MTVARELRQLVAIARDAHAVSAIDDFPEDPVPMIEQDRSLELITNGLQSDQNVYLADLWTTWLELYAYEIKVSRVRDVGVIYVGVNIDSNLDSALRVDAKACGTTLDEWLVKHAAPLKARLEEELGKAQEGD